MNNFKAVIFDLDGTLLDSIKDLADSMNTVLKDAGYPTHNIQSYKYFVGNGMEKLVFRAVPQEHRNNDTIRKLTEKMKQEYEKGWSIKTRPYDGIPQLLDQLAYMKIRMAVLSNKPHNFTKIMVDKLLSNWKFYPIYGESEFVPKKPDPTGAKKILHILNIKPDETIYLGDSDIDMQTATSAGVYPVGALWGFREKEELAAGGAKELIKNPVDFLKLFNN